MALQDNVVYKRTGEDGSTEYFAKMHERNTLYPHERKLSSYEAYIMVVNHKWKMVSL